MAVQYTSHVKQTETQRGVNKDSVGGGNIFEYPPVEFLEKYHDVYQIVGFNWV